MKTLEDVLNVGIPDLIKRFHNPYEWTVRQDTHWFGFVRTQWCTKVVDSFFNSLNSVCGFKADFQDMHIIVHHLYQLVFTILAPLVVTLTIWKEAEKTQQKEEPYPWRHQHDSSRESKRISGLKLLSPRKFLDWLVRWQNENLIATFHDLWHTICFGWCGSHRGQMLSTSMKDDCCKTWSIV